MSSETVKVDTVAFETKLRNFIDFIDVRGKLEKINPICFVFIKKRCSFYFQWCSDDAFLFIYGPHIERFHSFEGNDRYNMGLAISFN